MNLVSIILSSSLFAGESEWWMDIPDEQLQASIELGLQRSPDALIARERVVQADAVAAQQRAGFLPSIAASWSSNTQPRDALGFGFGLGSLGSIPGVPATEEEEEEELFTAGTAAVQLNVPLDVWGSAYSRFAAAKADRQASQSDLHNTHLALGLNIASAYYDVVASKLRLEIVNQQIESSRILLASTTMRQQRAEATSLDVLQQRQQLTSIESQLPRTKLGLKVAQQRLSLLMGVDPSQVQAVGDQFPSLHSISSLSEDEVLLSRPDVQAAEHRLRAAQKRRYASMTALLPSLSVGGQVSRQMTRSSKDEEWNSIDAYAFSTGVSLTVFQGGAKWAALQSAKAAERIADESLRKTKLTAQQEFLQAVENERSNEAILLAALNNVSAADKAFAEAQNRYNEGLTPLITLITTQQNYLQAQLNHIQSQRDVFTGRLQTYRVLGGARMEDSK